MAAKWFDSPCLLRQVIECTNMKRALAALEPTVITISIMLLKEIVIDYKDELSSKGDTLLKFIDEFRSAILNGEKFSVDHSSFLLTWKYFCNEIESLDLDGKVKHVISKRKENKVLQFLMGFVRMLIVSSH